MIALIGFRNLLHERRRFLASVAAVAFAILLVLVQLGLFAGLAANASQIIDRSPGDLWVTGRNTGEFQWGQPIPKRALYVARSTPGVAWARELIMGWTQLRHPEGGIQQLQVLGFDPAHRVGAPWNVVEGSLASLGVTGHVALDRSAGAKVAPFGLGDHREMLDRRVRVTAITEGITSFTTVPFVFTSIPTAHRLVPYLGPDDTVYVVVGLTRGADPERVAATLRHRLPRVDVHTTAAFSAQTRYYWVFETGTGIGFLLTALLAVAVGTVILSQAVYTATIEHLPEYGTLKAMGYPNLRLAGIVAWQALLAGIAGALPGCVAGVAVVTLIRNRGLAAALEPAFVLTTIAAGMAAAVLAALGAVRRVWTVEPALVFRGG